MITVDVPLAERSYQIHIGQRLLVALPEWLPACIGRCQHTVIIFDEKLTATVRELSSALIEAGYRTSLLSVPSGEGSKSIEQASQLCKPC